jgi:hypothetical protein
MGNYFFEYLKASIADLITLLSTLKAVAVATVTVAVATGDVGDSCADPCQEFKQGFLGGF